MAVKKDHRSLIAKLRKQVKILERKEEKARRQLGNAVKKIRKLGRTYKTKLNNKLRSIKSKVAAAKLSTYAKVAANLESKMLKSIQAKAKALGHAITKIEKKHVSKLTKGMSKKRKGTTSKKSSTRTAHAKSSVKRMKRGNTRSSATRKNKTKPKSKRR